jgi:hypothetical protein
MAAGRAHAGLTTWVHSSSALTAAVLVGVALVLLLASAWWRETGGPSTPWVWAVRTVLLVFLLDALAAVVVIRFFVLS